MFSITSHRGLLLAALVFCGLFAREVSINLHYLREGQPIQAKVTYMSKRLVQVTHKDHIIWVKQAYFSFYRQGETIAILWLPNAAQPGAFVPGESAREAAPMLLWQRGIIYLGIAFVLLGLYVLPWFVPSFKTTISIG